MTGSVHHAAARRTVRAARIGALIVTWVAAPLPGGAQIAERQVVTRGELQAAGVLRPSDVLQLAQGWSAGSLDQVTWSATPDALPAPGWGAATQRAWEVFVDDLRVTVDVHGLALLDLLPVSLAAVDSVEIVRGASLVAGGIAPRGVVRFHTARPRGVRAELSRLRGNERGDPGPFRYTPLATPNVDRIAADDAETLGYGAARWSVEAMSNRIAGISSDLLVLPRRRADDASTNRVVEESTVAARAGIRASGSWHELLAGRSRYEGAQFVPLADDEVPVRTEWRHAGIRGELPGLAASRVVYQLQRSDVSVGEPAAQRPIGAAHERAAVRGGVEIAGGRAHRVRIGAAAVRWAATRAAGVDTTRVEGTAYGAVAGEGRRGLSWEIAGALTGGGGTVAPKGVARARLPVAPRTAASVAVALLHALAGEDGAWIDAHVLGAPAASRSRLATGAARVEHAVGARATLFVGVGAVSAVGLGVLARPGSEGCIASPAGGEGACVHAASGTRLVGEGGVDARPWPGVRARATYRRVLSTGGTLAASAAAVPVDLVHASASWTPARTLLLGATLHARSATRWAAPPGATSEPADDAVGPAAAPGMSRLDVSAQQWLVGRRVRAVVVFRNLLDADERYAPGAARLSRRFYASVAVGWPAAAGE